jgi:hypothetical protein
MRASPQIANPQIAHSKISLVSRSANRKYTNLQRNSSVSNPDPNWFASNSIFYLRNYISDYEMPCNSKAVPKAKSRPSI